MGNDELESWWATVRDKPAMRKAVKQLATLNRSEREDWITLLRVKRACLGAASYTADKDPAVRFRADMAEERRAAHQLADAARTLSAACERGSRAMFWATTKASPAGYLVRTPSEGPIPSDKLYAEWFSALADALSGELPELHGGPWAKRFDVGNMSRSSAIKDGRPTTVQTMLSFELAITLRMHTAGRAPHVRYNFYPMPTDGRPCAHIIASFVNATLGSELDRKAISDLLKEIPKDARLVKWATA